MARFGRSGPSAGSKVVVAGQASPAPPPVRWGAPDSARVAEMGRARTYVKVSDWSAIGRKRWSCVVQDDETGLLSALACGDRRGVSTERRRLFRRTGVAHLLAISGFHVGLVTGWAYALMRGAQRLASLVYPRGLSGLWAAGFGVGAAWTYVAVAGSPVSGVRALWMCAVALLSRELGVRFRAADLVGMAGCVAVMLEPCVVATVSFQLSYGAVCGLVRFGPRLARLRSWKTWWSASMQSSMAATAGTLPAVAWWFQEVAVFGVWVNMWAMPWVATIVAPFAFVSALDIASVSDVAARGGAQAVELLCWTLTPFDVEPFRPAVDAVGALLLAAILVSPLSLRTSALFASLVLLTRRVPL